MNSTERTPPNPIDPNESGSDEQPILEMQTLAREIQPERDLWPELARQIGSHRSQGPTANRDRSRLRRWSVAAALALVAGAVAWRLAVVDTPPAVEVRIPPPPVTTPASDPAAGGVSLAAYAEIDRTLATIRDDLRRSVEAHQEKLPPETRALVFENLKTIDRAIAEIETALEGAPASSELVRTYIDYREREIELLRQANRLVARL